MTWMIFNQARLDSETGLASKWDARSIWMILSKLQGFGGGIDQQRHGLPYAIEFNAGKGPGGLHHDTGRGQLATLKAMVLDSSVKRIQLALPSIPGSQPQRPYRQPQQAFVGSTSTLESLAPFSVTMGFIDHGCAWGHPQFARGNGSRVRYLWDQSDQQPKGGFWTPCSVFDYGCELDSAAIQSSIQNYGRSTDLYRRLGYNPATRRYAHGTHVMDLATGSPNPLWRVSRPLVARDAAGDVDIVFVQLPWRPIKDTSGSAFAVHILDGIRYILTKSKPGAVVINISDGAYAGPHDGSSLVEKGMDELVHKFPNLSVIIAAGNAYESKLHAKKRLLQGKAGKLYWKVLPDDFKESYCEIWVDKRADIEFSLTPPGGAPQTVPIGEAHVLAVGGTLLAGVVHCASDPVSAKRCILIALAPTRWRSDSTRPVAPHGLWTLTVLNNGSPTEINAWIERDNPALGDSGPKRQSYFVQNTPDTDISREETLNSLGHGKNTVVVGGYRLIDQRIARYSSAGPGARAALPMLPALTAPSDQSATLFGLRAAGTSGSATNRMDGTSVAAPQVARKLANALHAKRNYFSDVNAAVTAISPVPPVLAEAPTTPDRDGPHSNGRERAGATLVNL